MFISLLATLITLALFGVGIASAVEQTEIHSTSTAQCTDCEGVPGSAEINPVQPDSTVTGRWRSRKDIDTVIDANRGALMAIYFRELRDNPRLQGKVEFLLTIEPEGNVSYVVIRSSELNDEKLEKILAVRVKMFQFGRKNVDVVTVLVPVMFTPGH